MTSKKVININIGVLGHVDSGKTSLCKVLSTTASTACFDKNPQSKERGITLDLGFSSFQISNSDLKCDLKTKLNINDEDLLFTLVDCPGHASLIRTIICGAQIIDIMILVIDVTKGIQTQTAECLVIGEILCDKVLIVLNKIDLLAENNQKATITKMHKRINNVLSKTVIKNYRIVEVSACPGSDEISNDTSSNLGIDNLLESLLEMIDNPLSKRMIGSNNPLIFAVDHCFSIRGQGTILTGTVTSGTIEVGNALYIPSIDDSRKVKSMQMFKKPINRAIQGDRIGVCVTQMDPSQLERGLVCLSSPRKPLSLIHTCITKLHPITYFKHPIRSKGKLHFTIGQDTVMGTVTLFSSGSLLIDEKNFDWSLEYEYLELFSDSESPMDQKSVYVLIQFERNVVCADNGIIIGSKLDTDIHSNSCRLAFHGRILWMSGSAECRELELTKLKVFKRKSRVGQIERICDPQTVIVKNLFKKNTNMEVFQRYNIRLEELTIKEEKDAPQYLLSPIFGYIEGNFGQSGKCKVILKDELPLSLVEVFSSGKKKKGKLVQENSEAGKVTINVFLDFKRYIFDLEKKNIQ